jgi:8-oxo-dGTP pyrophosphatase MutT (NUDIX family)
MVERDDGDVLLVRQSYRDGWATPGGLLHRGEEPAVGARREAKEEIGVDVETLGEPLVIIDAKARRVDVVFRCCIPPPVPATFETESVEILEARWFPKDALPPMQKETAEAYLRVFDG